MTTDTPRMDAAELLAIGIGDGRPLYAAGVALEKALYEREDQLRECVELLKRVNGAIDMTGEVGAGLLAEVDRFLRARRLQESKTL